jgi:putative ABC transport system ATP-binding protein
MQEKIQPAARALADLTTGDVAPELVEELANGLERALPASGEVPLGALDWLKLAADSARVNLEIVEASSEELAEWLRWDEPLLTAVDAVDEGGRRWTRWIVVRRGARGASVRTRGAHEEDAQRELELEELVRLVGFEGARRQRWLKARLGQLGHADEETAPGAAPAQEPHDAPGPPPFRRLIQLVQPDRGDVLAVVTFAVAIGVLSLATPLAVQALVNFVALGGALPPLIVVALLLFLGLSFAALLGGVQTWVVEMLQRRLFVRVLSDLTARLPRVAVSVHDSHYAPELVNRFLDVTQIQKLGAFLLLDGLALLLSVVVGLVVLAFYHPLLLAFDILLLGSIALIVFGPVKQGIRSAKAESSAKYEVVAWLEEIARNALLYKSSGALRFVFERSDRLVRQYLERRSEHFRIVFRQYIGSYVLQILASTALLGVGGLLVMQNTLTLGQLVAAELIVTLVVSSVAKLGKHLESFYDLMAATDKVGKLLDLPVEPMGGEHHLLAPGGRGMELELRDLAWAASSSSTVLQGIRLHAPSGARVGLCGPSASGKSSLLQLMWGLRRPTRGAIRVDGRDLRTLSLESLRRAATLVDHVELFEGTIRENVRLTRASVTDDDVHEALRAVGLLDEVELFPQGIDTTITAHGRPLSGSQIVRLQIARAIAGRPRLLLVTDFFGDLSKEARESLLAALFDPGAPWTLVIATNEPEVLDRCDSVLSLPSGAVTRGPRRPAVVGA